MLAEELRKQKPRRLERRQLLPCPFTRESSNESSNGHCFFALSLLLLSHGQLRSRRRVATGDFFPTVLYHRSISECPLPCASRNDSFAFNLPFWIRML